MTQVQIQQDLADQLTATGERVSIRSEAGRLLGVFVPTSPESEELQRQAMEAFSDEEVEHALQVTLKEPGGQTWPEIREELERRWPSI